MSSLKNALSVVGESDVTFAKIYKQMDLVGIDTYKADEIISTEGLASFLSQKLITIADIVAGLVLVNKTNGLNMLVGFKRTELRQYSDKNFATMKRINNTPITITGKVELAKPDGMSAKFQDGIAWLNEAYKELPVEQIGKQVLNNMTEIYECIKSSDTQEEFDSKVRIEQYERAYTGLSKLIEKLQKKHSKMFVKDISKITDSAKQSFTDCYVSMKDFKSTTDALLTLEQSFIKLGSAAELPNKISDVVGKIESHLKRAEFEINKKFLDSLIELVRTGAKTFEMFSTMMHTQMVLEHNHVLNNGSLDEAIKQHNSTSEL